MLLPNCGPLPQISQTCAMENSVASNPERLRNGQPGPMGNFPVQPQAYRIPRAIASLPPRDEKRMPHVSISETRGIFDGKPGCGQALCRLCAEFTSV